MEVRPYSLPGTSLVAQLRDALAPRLSEWRDYWGLEASLESAAGFGVARASSDPMQLQPALRLETEDGAAWAVVQIDAERLSRFGAALLQHSIPVAETSPSEFLTELGTEALLDLAARFNPQQPGYAAALHGTLAECLGSSLLEDARCVEIELALGGEAARMLLPWAVAELFVASFIDAALAARPAGELARRLESLTRESVKAEACLGSAEITLDALGSLRVGDVLCLDTGLDEPLMLNFPGSRGRFSGFLGRRQQRLALRIESFIPS